MLKRPIYCVSGSLDRGDDDIITPERSIGGTTCRWVLLTTIDRVPNLCGTAEKVGELRAELDESCVDSDVVRYPATILCNTTLSWGMA